jgi:hypothetical protein
MRVRIPGYQRLRLARPRNVDDSMIDAGDIICGHVAAIQKVEE